MHDSFQGIKEDHAQNMSADGRYVSFCFQRRDALKTFVDVVTSNHRVAGEDLLEPSVFYLCVFLWRRGALMAT